MKLSIVIAEGKTTKFLSEAELQKNKEQHGGSLEDGTFSGMSLTQAIIAQREEKEQKFQDGWKTMKQGACRLRRGPLLLLYSLLSTTPIPGYCNTCCATAEGVHCFRFESVGLPCRFHVCWIALANPSDAGEHMMCCPSVAGEDAEDHHLSLFSGKNRPLEEDEAEVSSFMRCAALTGPHHESISCSFFLP